MKRPVELSRCQMRAVIGGGGLDEMLRDKKPTGHCFIDGELIFETICYTNEQCQAYYGEKAECYI